MLHHFSSTEKALNLLRRNFLTGVFVLLPFLAVAWILGKVLGALWAFLLLIPEDWQPIHHFEPFNAHLVEFGLASAFTVVFIFLVSLLGWVSKQYFGVKFLGFMGQLIQRIPIVRAVYSSLNQLIKTMAPSDGGQQFNRVVYVEYPRKECWALAFVTSQARTPMPGKFINLYVPTTPNPTSGFHLIVDEKDVIDSHMSVEEAFKTILSLGIAQEKP